MKFRNSVSCRRLGLLVLLLSSLACADDSIGGRILDAEFKVNIFYPAHAGIDSMLESSVKSAISPDFEYHYKPVDSSTWSDASSLAGFLVSTQQSSPADGFFLACKNTDLDEISDQFRATFPKVPFVDSFAPVLLAANIVSYKYAVLTGSLEGFELVEQLIEKLGIEDHLTGGASDLFENYLLVQGELYSLTTTKDKPIEEISYLGRVLTRTHPNYWAFDIETIALAGCEGFLDIGVAEEAQEQLAALDPPIPLQVINPIKASIGLLHSMIRNKVWISVPRGEKSATGEDAEKAKEG